jgi:hypothetical protein
MRRKSSDLNAAAGNAPTRACAPRHRGAFFQNEPSWDNSNVPNALPLSQRP